MRFETNYNRSSEVSSRTLGHTRARIKSETTHSLERERSSLELLISVKCHGKGNIDFRWEHYINFHCSGKRIRNLIKLTFFNKIFLLSKQKLVSRVTNYGQTKYGDRHLLLYFSLVIWEIFISDYILLTILLLHEDQTSKILFLSRFSLELSLGQK